MTIGDEVSIAGGCKHVGYLLPEGYHDKWASDAPKCSNSDTQPDVGFGLPDSFCTNHVTN